MSLFGYECKKILIKQYALFIFSAVIVLRLLSLPSSLEANYGFGTSAEKNAYLEMLKPLSGMLNDEKEEKIVELKERLIEAQNLMSQLREAYSSNDTEKIEALDRELEKYDEILENDTVIERVFEQYDYASADKASRAIIPVKKVGITEKVSANYPFLLCICFCCAFAVMAEQTSKTHLIIRTAPNGQGKTMAAKLGVLFIVIGVTSAVLTAADLVTMSFQLPREYWRYNICSLEKFAGCPIKISIIGAFAAVAAMRLIGALFIGSAAMLTAHFTKSYVAGVFPYIALPVVADYVSERDSQSYFLPTGLLKGWGYFYGDVAEPNYKEYVIFHGVPLYCTCLIAGFALLFVIAACVILVRAGKNRLAKKRRGISMIGAVGAAFSLLLLTSCSAKTGNVAEQYGGSISVYDNNNENSRYKFEIETIMTDDSGHSTNALNITDKQTGETERYEFSPFEDEIHIQSLFATEDRLLFCYNHRDIVSLDLNDFSLTTIYAAPGLKKVVFGLVFDFGDEERRFSADGAFTDGKNIFVYDWHNGIAKPKANGDLHILVSDDTSSGLEFDGKAFYYISPDGILHKYDLASRKNTAIYENVERYTLDGDADHLYFRSRGENVELDKKALTE